MSQEPPTITEQRAVIINRQCLRWIEVPDPHVITTDQSGGWWRDDLAGRAVTATG